MIERYPASEFIKMTLDSLKMSISDLSRESGVSKKVLSEILSNKVGYNNKIDYKIAPVLGFDIGLLCQIEAKYIEYKSYAFSKCESIFDSQWCFRKEKKIDIDKYRVFLEILDRLIYEKDLEKQTDNNPSSIMNFLYNDLLKMFNENHILKRDLSDLFDILPSNIKIIKFDGINIRGMSRKWKNNYYICINSKLNNTFQKFYMTLVHELIHFHDDDAFLELSNEKNNKSNETVEEEEHIDEIALNFLLNNKKNIVDSIQFSSEMQLECFSKEIGINYKLLKGYYNYKKNNHILDESDLVDYGKEEWWEI